MRKVTIVATLAMALCSGATARAAGEIESVLTPVRARGLVVHLGCEGEMFADWLRGNDSTVAHVLCVDPANVAKARDLIRKEGLYGPVSVSRLVGESLPYADNLVNLLVATDLCGVAQEEILRVLVPGGEAFLPAAEGMRKVVKPWPDDIDEWTHDLHDAGGNPVASDRVVGPPRQLQWTAGPLWARSHGWTPSVSAMVSARGRLFAIVDETLTCVDGTVPSKWVLTARDAFNGVLLWKVPVPQWGSAEHTGTPDNGAGITTGRFTMPPQVGKRLVAVGDTVYVTLGARAPVTALDAATGKVRGVYKGTERTDEILCSDRRLYLAINPEQKGAVVDKGETPAPVPGKQVCVVDAKTGRMLWKKGPFTAVRTAKLQDAYGRLELAAEGGRVFLLTAEAIECLDGKSGERVWSVDRPVIPADAVRRIGFAGMFEYLLTVMVVHDGVVLVAQPEPNTHHTYHTMPGALTAFDAKDGRVMWKHGYGGWGHCTQPDVFVVGDTVWTHVDAKTEYGSVWGSGKKAKDGSKVNYRIQALDLKTGALRKEQPTKDIFNVGHHHRCYRNRSTERFLLASRRGAEFVDLASGENTQNHWVRSGCLLGNLPCNGLLYVAPHPCGCYRTALITGFNALAPAPSSAKATEGRSASPRLVKGLAFGGIPDAKSQMPDSQDWPTYRHDPQRSGATESPVPTKLAVAWTAKVGGKPSAPVIANGKVLVADVDAHTVHALGADDGKTLWSHTADGRVDSPPTIHQGRAIFGSADGRVTCLRASDGALAWRFTAAPQAHRVMAHGQLESPWPVHGSVLVHDGKVWCGAGRSSYLDGGIHVYALDLATGAAARHETIYHPDPKTGKMTPETSANTMDGLLSDIPSSDGANVFIRHLNVSAPGERSKLRVYSTGGFLDPSWFNRTYWKAGRVQTSGVLALGKHVAFGMEVYGSRSRETIFKPGSKPYRLQCHSLKATKPDKAKRGKRGGPKPVWEQRIPIRAIALVRAADTLFVAGSPDVVDPQDPHGAWEGRKGGVLAAFEAASGKKIAEYKLPAPPVWDGMAAANGRLYVSVMDGSVICLSAQE